MSFILDLCGRSRWGGARRGAARYSEPESHRWLSAHAAAAFGGGLRRRIVLPFPGWNNVWLVSSGPLFASSHLSASRSWSWSCRFLHHRQIQTIPNSARCLLPGETSALFTIHNPTTTIAKRHRVISPLLLLVSILISAMQYASRQMEKVFSEGSTRCGAGLLVRLVRLDPSPTRT